MAEDTAFGDLDFSIQEPSPEVETGGELGDLDFSIAPPEVVAEPAAPEGELGDLDFSLPKPTVDANEQFRATTGLDRADPNKLSPLSRPPNREKQQTVAEVTQQPDRAEDVSLRKPLPRDVGEIAKDIGGSTLVGAAAVPRNVGETVEAIGQLKRAAPEFIRKHPVASMAAATLIPGLSTQIATAALGGGKREGKVLEFVGKAASDFWAQQTEKRRKKFISEKGQKSTHPAWIISSGIAETTPQLIADYVTGQAAGRLGKVGTSIITSAVEGNTAAASQKGQVEDAIKAMSDDELAQLPIYEEALEKADGDIAKAREIAIATASNRAYGATFLTTTLTSLALDKVAGGTLDKWIQDPKIGKIGLKTVFRMAGMEATEEAIQSGFETMINNQTIGKPIFEGVPEAMGYGAATGAILGGTLTGAGSILQNNVQAETDAAPEGADGVAPADPSLPTTATPEAAQQAVPAPDAIPVGQPEAAPQVNTATSATGEIGVQKDTPQSGTDFGKASEQNEKELQKIVDDGKKSVSTTMKQLLVDADAEVKDRLTAAGAKDAVMMKNVTTGASASAAMDFKQGMSDTKNALGKTPEKLMADFIDATRTVEASQIQEGRDKVLKSRQGITQETAQEWLNEFESTHSPEDVANVKAASEVYFATMRNQLDQMRDAGLVSQESHDFLTEHHKHYSPRLFVEALDDAVVGGKRGDLDSGLKELDTGSEKAMVTDPSILMSHVISRAQSRIFKNRANNALADFVATDPDTGIGRIVEDKGQAKRNEDIVTAYVNGQQRLIAMPKGLAEQWNGTPPSMSSDVAQIIQWGSGTKVLKALATGANPEFPISNLPRDIAFAWFNSGQYSRFLPKALGQMATDYKGVVKDSVLRKGAYKDYVKEGGGMDYLSTQGKVVSKPWSKRGAASGVVGKTFDILAYLGETSEIATRLAVRQRGIQNGLSPQEATYAARNMLDFAQGGKLTKAADNAIPYLNAAVQGTRGTLRTFKTDPKGAAIKASQLVGIGYALAYAARSMDEEAWDSISDRDKATKWIIPLGVKRKDANGNSRHAYIAIAKDQGQQIFSAVGQSMADGIAGKPWNPQLIDAISSLFPVEFANINPPIANAATAYFGNYDTWTKNKVWRGYQDISPSNERKLTTPKIAQGLSTAAAKLGIEISPERLATSTSKLIPTSNPLASMLSDIPNMALTDEDNDTIIENLRKVPGARRLIRFSRPSNPSDRQAQEADRFKIDTAGKTRAELRREITDTKTSRNDVRQGNNLRADEFMTDEQATSLELRQWLLSNIKEIPERKRLWMRERGKHPDRIEGPFNIKSQRRRRKRKR